MEKLMQRKKKVEEYEATIHNLMLETTSEFIQFLAEENTKFQVCTTIEMHPIAFECVKCLCYEL